VDDALRITVEELKKRMDAGEDFTVIDVRNPEAWAENGHGDTGSDSGALGQTGSEPVENSQEQTRRFDRVPKSSFLPALIVDDRFGSRRVVHPYSQVSDTFLIFETVSVGGKVASTLDGDQDGLR
jgi:rhodanese-related sulfurtransferase